MNEDDIYSLSDAEMDNFCQNIWLQRTLQGLTQYDIASESLRQGTINSYERGNRIVPARHISLLLERLNMPLETMIAPPDYETLFKQAETRKIITLYRSLPPDLKDIALQQIYVLVHYVRKRKNKG